MKCIDYNDEGGLCEETAHYIYWGHSYCRHHLLKAKERYIEARAETEKARAAFEAEWNN